MVAVVAVVDVAAVINRHLVVINDSNLVVAVVVVG